MSAAERNRRRIRAVDISRAWRGLLAAVALSWGWLLLRPFVATRWAYRRVFMTDGALRVASGRVLADLRDFTFARSSAFDPDPIIMARRQGRRDVWLRISNYLNLDEAEVQNMMEVDDGI